MYIQCSICVFAPHGFSACSFVHDPFGSYVLPTTWQAIVSCECVCVPVKTSLLCSRPNRALMIREIHQHTHIDVHTEHNGSRRRVEYHSLGRFHGSLDRKCITAPMCSWALLLWLLISFIYFRFPSSFFYTLITVNTVYSSHKTVFWFIYFLDLGLLFIKLYLSLISFKIKRAALYV